MFQTSQNNLKELIQVLQDLPDNEIYWNPISSLSGASIGQHTRHIIELYQCLLNGYAVGIVNYDNRKRDNLLETNREAAIEALLGIATVIEQPDKEMTIQCDSLESGLLIKSNYYREVYYNLEHCIHHQALIKVGLVTIGLHAVPEQFGVAPATTQYRKQCAQ
jgi:uncharacterized damage-inducible protein DinB